MSVIQAVMGLGSGTAARVAAAPDRKPDVPGTFRPGCPLFRCRSRRCGGVGDVSSIVTLLVVVAIIAGVFWLVRQQQATKARELDDAKADARRWVERLGGQVLNLVGTNEAAKQALADAAERYTAAGSPDRPGAAAPPQARQVTETALRGPLLRPRRAHRDGPGPRARSCRRCPGSSGPARSPRPARSRWRGTATAPPRTRRAATALLPRRHGRRPSRPARLVLRAVVAPRAGRRCLGPRARPCCSPRCSAAWPAWPTPTGSPTAQPPTAWTAAWTAATPVATSATVGATRGRLGRRLRRRRLRRRRLLLIRRDRPET